MHTCNVHVHAVGEGLTWAGACHSPTATSAPESPHATPCTSPSLLSSVIVHACITYMYMYMYTWACVHYYVHEHNHVQMLPKNFAIMYCTYMYIYMYMHIYMYVLFYKCFGYTWSCTMYMYLHMHNVHEERLGNIFREL